MRCSRCDKEMQPGIALAQTFTAGSKDFTSDAYAVTFSAGGPGKIIECAKCQSCGYSVTKQEQ